MAYRVELLPRAQADLDNLYAWVIKNAPTRGPIWFAKLQAAVLSLAEHPSRCAVVPSLSTQRQTVRQLLYGRKRYIYRIYFTIVDRTVQVLHIRAGARKTPQSV